MRESQVEKLIVSQAGRLGLKSRKMSGQNDNGFPDRAFWKKGGDGKIVFMEIKRPGEEPTKLQLKRIEELRADGFAVDWFDNLPAAAQWLRDQFR